MIKYPIGLQDFRKIRKGGFLYVDKTDLIFELLNSGSYYFLSRPRRFGKSLLLSTIKEIVTGNAGLFNGLKIEHRWNWKLIHPVIQISFASIGVRSLGLEVAITQALTDNAERLEVTLTKTAFDQQFRELITKSAIGSKVVILIDEYDKPVTDHLEDVQLAQTHRDILKNFYSVLKDADEHILFLLITGVSKFTKVSIFSDLNNLQDITLSSRYATLTGITQSELDVNFAHDLEKLTASNPSVLSEIKEWYNGYSWNGVDFVYNPFSVLNFFSDQQFRNYWFATGTPTFLVEQLKLNRDFQFDKVRLGELALGNFKLENIETVPLLFQTGYLTIKRYDPALQLYELDYPNREVKSSLLDALLSSYRSASMGDSNALTGDLGVSLENNDFPMVIGLLNSLIASIPYDHWKADSESIFHIIFYLAFKKVGVFIQTEVHSSTGRCDVLVKTKKYIYAVELKLNASVQSAMRQILEQGYLTPYLSDSRTKVAVAISFSSLQREIADYLVEIF